MEFSEDRIEEMAKAIFARERPNDNWLIQTLPRQVGQDVSSSVSIKVRNEYREKARLKLEAEADQ